MVFVCAFKLKRERHKDVTCKAESQDVADTQRENDLEQQIPKRLDFFQRFESGWVIHKSCGGARLMATSLLFYTGESCWWPNRSPASPSNLRGNGQTNRNIARRMQPKFRGRIPRWSVCYTQLRPQPCTLVSLISLCQCLHAIKLRRCVSVWVCAQFSSFILRPCGLSYLHCALILPCFWRQVALPFG